MRCNRRGVIDIWKCSVLRAGCGGVAALGQALKAHALFKVLGEQVARLQEQKPVVVVAKGLRRLQLQLHGVARGIPLQRLFQAGEQIAAADQEFNRFVEHIQHFTQGVFECPSQRHDALFGDFHPTIVP